MEKKDRPTALDLGRGERLEPDSAAYLAKCEEKLGFVPNVLAAYAFNNAKLRAFILMADDLMLGDSGLSRTEREMIAVAVSAINHCHYCLTSHGAALRQRAGDPELGEAIAQNWRAAGLEPRHEAMLEFCVKLTEAPDKVREADREALRRTGFSDRDIWDISAVASFYNMTNRMVAATDTRPNREYHYMAREPQAEGQAGRPGKPPTGPGKVGRPAAGPAAASTRAPRSRRASSRRGEKPARINR